MGRPPRSPFDLDVNVPEDVYGDLDAELTAADERAEAAYDWLSAQTSFRLVDSMRVLTVRCPVKGCVLAEVYRFPIRSGGERYLARTVTTRSTNVGFLNWLYSGPNCWGPRIWYPSACRHGNAKIEGAWLLDLVMLVIGAHHALETLEQARAGYPEAERRGIARRTFHPKEQVWRGKLGHRAV